MDYTSIEKQSFIIPGKYKGLWSAYYLEIIFTNGKKSEPIKMHCVTRGININCDVEVSEDGTVTIC